MHQFVYKFAICTFARIRLAQIGSLLIETTQEADEGKYECVASNEVGTFYSHAANLYVRGKNDYNNFTHTDEL